MKGLDVLKRFLIACSLLGGTLYADALENLLSERKNQAFSYDFERNEAQSDVVSKSWINPVMLQYTKSYSNQFGSDTTTSSSFSVGVDQPIFRSGGIYFAIKYAQAQRGANRTQIAMAKRETIAQAINLLFQMKKLKLEQKKYRFLIANDALDVKQKRDSYRAGILQSSFVDQAMLQANQDEIQKLSLEVSYMELKEQFSLLSDKNPEHLKLPHFTLLTLKKFKQHSLKLRYNKLRAKEKAYNAKMTWAKYLPTISIQGRYTDATPDPLFSTPDVKDAYSSYGFSISMPLNVNMLSDIEAAKVEKLKAQLDVVDERENIEAFYALVRRKLAWVDKKIALSKKDEKLYANMYRLTKDLQKAGEKTKSDVSMLYNGLQIRKLNQKIYKLEREMILLELYTKVSNEV